MNDPVIDEVRRVRHEISDEVGSDFNSLIARYRELNSQFEHAPLTRNDRRPPQGTGAAKSGELTGDNQTSPPGDR